MFNKTKMALLAGSMLIALPFAAQSQEEISFLVIDYDAPGMGEWWHLLVDTYNEQSGHTVAPRNTPASEYYSQVLIQAVSGAGADVLIVNPNNLGEMLAAEAVLPLTDMIEEAGLKDRIVEGGFDSLSEGGEIYALPITGRTLELIYNVCYFEEAGLEGPPTTPEEFLDYARQLVRRGDDGRVTRYGANMVNANEDPTYEMLLMWSIAHGGSYADEEGNFTVDSRAVIDALNFMKTLYDEELVPQGMTETDQRSLFATGGSAMSIDGQWQFPFIRENNPENFDCYKAAQHPWDGPGTGGNNMALAIDANTDHPEAAFEFLKTAASAELQGEFSNYSPLIPYGVNALSDEQLAAQPYLEPYIASSGNAHPVAIPGHEDKFNQIWPIIVDAVLRHRPHPRTQQAGQADHRKVEPEPAPRARRSPAQPEHAATHNVRRIDPQGVTTTSRPHILPGNARQADRARPESTARGKISPQTTRRRQNHLPENPMPAIERPSERARNRQQKSAVLSVARQTT